MIQAELNRPDAEYDQSMRNFKIDNQSGLRRTK